MKRWKALSKSGTRLYVAARTRTEARALSRRRFSASPEADVKSVNLYLVYRQFKLFSLVAPTVIGPVISKS